jgi:hypothetical protein
MPPPIAARAPTANRAFLARLSPVATMRCRRFRHPALESPTPPRVQSRHATCHAAPGMRALLIGVLMIGPLAMAEEPTPPDVLHGERYDGRVVERPRSDYALAVPRAILLVPRLLVAGLGAAAKPGMEWAERRRIPERVMAAITAEDGREGIRPVINYELGYRPSFGILYFYERIPRDGRFTLSIATGGPDAILASTHLTLPLPDRRFTVEVAGAYSRRDDELFTGIGMPDPARFARYLLNAGDATVGLSYQPLRSLRIAAGVDFGFRRFGNGTAYGGDPAIADVYCVRGADGECVPLGVDEQQVPGFNHGTQFAREILAVHVDSRRDERARACSSTARSSTRTASATTARATSCSPATRVPRSSCGGTARSTSASPSAT